MNRDWLHKKYWVENLSMAAIAKEAGVSVSKVRRSMQRFNIKRRSLSAAANEKWKVPSNRKKIADFAKTRVGVKNPFYGKRHTKETKKKLSAANRGRFIGENGSNWQGGKTKLNYAVRDCGAYHEWRNHIFERDNWTCNFCGVVGGNLHVDHIKPFSIILKENNIQSLEEAIDCEDFWNTDNGRVLCANCHRKTETYAGKIQQKVWSQCEKMGHK